jgi:hypothetical protein
VIPLKGFLYVLGGVLAIVAAIFVYTHVDDWKRARYNAKSVSAAAHGDTAAAFAAVADTTHAQGVVIRDNWRVLTSSSEVKRNPVAVKVAEKGNQVIANADKETSALRSANAQLTSQVHDLETRGEPPTPRAIPYVEPLYSFRSSSRSTPLLRLGVDYRVLPHVSAKIETSYEPPPATKPGEKAMQPEFRLTVGGHITFR